MLLNLTLRANPSATLMTLQSTVCNLFDVLM